MDEFMRKGIGYMNGKPCDYTDENGKKWIYVGRGSDGSDNWQ